MEVLIMLKLSFSSYSTMGFMLGINSKLQIIYALKQCNITIYFWQSE